MFDFLVPRNAAQRMVGTDCMRVADSFIVVEPHEGHLDSMHG